MADVAGEVDAEPALAALQEFGEGLELLPRDAARARWVHVLDRGEDALEERRGRRPCIGATEKPQLPATTVVTPWKHDIVAYGSKVICGS